MKTDIIQLIRYQKVGEKTAVTREVPAETKEEAPPEDAPAEDADKKE